MHDASRAARQALYNTTRWRRLRLRHLADHPLCAYCLRRGVTTSATVVDHVDPHRGDVARFFDPSNLQSLCACCHNRDKSREERGGAARVAFDATGRPIDPGHSHSSSRSRARGGAVGFIGRNLSYIDMGPAHTPPQDAARRFQGRAEVAA